MHAIISTAVIAALAFGVPAATGNAIANSAHSMQADRVSILKIEGMT